MKKTVLAIVLAAAVISLYSCGSGAKTKENLITAAQVENDAMLRYATYSGKARLEGKNNLRKLFEAVSLADMIHTKNHQRILSVMGTDFKPVENEFLTTDESLVNLDNAINTVNHEISEVYPGFLKTAEGENNLNAVRTFTFAKLAGEKHAELFRQAYKSLKADGNDSEIPGVWYVCPRCGNVCSDLTDMETCDICSLETTEFMTVQ